MPFCVGFTFSFTPLSVVHVNINTKDRYHLSNKIKLRKVAN